MTADLARILQRSQIPRALVQQKNIAHPTARAIVRRGISLDLARNAKIFIDKKPQFAYVAPQFGW